MALAFRIDRIVKDGAGRLHLAYTTGKAPLPASASGHGMIFMSLADVKQLIDDDAEAWMTPDVMLRLALAVWKRADSNLTTIGSLVGKTLTFDATKTQALLGIQ